MKTDDFDFYLPENLIAQTPLKEKDSSKLMILDKNTGEIKHEIFHNIINYLNEGDVLVLNDTKVIPARLIGIKEETNATIEVLLLRNINDDNWECLVKPAKRVHIGTVISFGEGKLKAKCTDVLEDGIRHFTLIYDGILYNVLDELGSMPLPPYIHEKLKDKDRYQTVYAKNIGSAAAPTAGLHFTKELLNDIKNKGITICYITLHVGLGTFRPVNVTDVKTHKMHSEYYEIGSDACNIINETKKNGGKVFCVGTTSCRTVESAADENGYLVPKKGITDIFIYPGYKFKVLDNLITNFHLPESTLLMLISALATREMIMDTYKIAVEQKYRFFSFGDAMLIK